MAGFEEIGKQFMQHYYNNFDTNRPALATLYMPNSMLTFEGEQYMGVENIFQKLSSFNKIRHDIAKFDIQPSLEGCVLCFVNGDLYIDDNENPLKFSQIFHIVPNPAGGFYCLNDIFRLNLSG